MCSAISLYQRDSIQWVYTFGISPHYPTGYNKVYIKFKRDFKRYKT